MKDLFKNQEVQLDEELREAVAEKLEKIKLEQELSGLKTQVSFLGKKLAEAEVDLARMEYFLDKTSESKNNVFQNFVFQLENVEALQEENIQLKRELKQMKRTFADASEIVKNLVPESFPPCERRTFQELKNLFEKEDAKKKQYRLFEKEIKKRGLRALKTEIIG